ncbi:hypothetical protein GW866_02135, partial [bacterium]|nr:hypothetical protein [bacterium]
MRRHSILTLFLILLTACEAVPTPNQAPTATPTALLMVTVPPDATPTPTPFQPLLDETAAATPTSISPSTTITSEQPTDPPGTPTPIVITATPDAASLLPTGWIPPNISAPNYAPAPFPILTD